jgi:hypothetical protein
MLNASVRAAMLAELNFAPSEHTVCASNWCRSTSVKAAAE